MSSAGQPAAESPQRIGKLFVYLASDETGREGVALAEVLVNGTAGVIPLVAGDEGRPRFLAPLAEQLVVLTGKTLQLVEFTGRVDVRLVEGRSHG